MEKRRVEKRVVTDIFREYLKRYSKEYEPNKSMDYIIVAGAEGNNFVKLSSLEESKQYDENVLVTPQVLEALRYNYKNSFGNKIGWLTEDEISDMLCNYINRVGYNNEEYYTLMRR